MSLCGALFLCLVLSAPASAARALLTEHAVRAEEAPGGSIEGPCGVAVSAAGQIYVSAYYAHAVESFSPSGAYQSSLSAGTSPEGPCGLAITAGGALYANRWHEGVSRLLPGALVFDEAESTGVAVDSSGNVYVDDRTDVAIYEPSGTLLRTIAADPQADYYGVAVSGEKVYVADAATGTVKAFEADGTPSTPIQQINGSATPQGEFVSLVDAALAVDPTNGHLVVVDNLQPGYLHPKGAIEEFDASGAFLSQLPGNPIDGAPSGLAFSATGTLFATSGNSEEGTVFSYGAYSGLGPLSIPGGGGGEGSASASAPTSQGSPASQDASTSAAGDAPASASETIQRGHLRVGVNAELAPRKLPRKGSAPVTFSVAATISATKGSTPPQLQRIEIEINRYGHIEPKGLPVCEMNEIQPATNEAALEACGPSLVGTGNFKANVLISQQAPFPSDGKVYAFNGTWKGRPAILAHVYGTKPVPTSSTIPFVIGSSGKGSYGAKLTASLPQVTSKWGYVTGISMKLGKSFSSHGKRRSYLSASCPAPKGFPGASFPLSRTSLDFAGGKKVSTVLNRSCKAK
ncbi:MAG TPA: NHL repeat-containing protein [Solirubrobacterales bacterium]|nr:NHL repeat-containing protein [Solirubrobacterales bacterium]